MKYIYLILISLAVISCQKTEEKDYVSFSGKIVHQNSDSLKIYNKDYTKIIKVAPDGSFKDTLHLEPGIYRLYDGGEYASLYLKNGYDLTMTLDTELFDESIKFEGVGAEQSNFLAEKSLMNEKLFDINVEGLDSLSLQNKFDDIEAQMNEFIASKTGLDTMLSNQAKREIADQIKGNSNYLGAMIALREKLPKGVKSPIFEGYENHEGGTTDFSDLAGKYIYIDVWATWCGPCKAEIPFLKEVEAAYHDKNIHFVSISIDKAEDHQKWVDMVNDKDLGGIQLFADNDWNSKFVTDYYIKGIPRFLLIDPEGNVVSPDAPRPSDPKLKDLLNELL
jgi:thiol-disulfide isomerase/thioredoxin